MRDSRRVGTRIMTIISCRPVTVGPLCCQGARLTFSETLQKCLLFPPLAFQHGAAAFFGGQTTSGSHFTSALMCPQSNLYNLVGLSDRKMTLPSEIPVRNSDQSAGLLLPSTHRIKENKNALSKLAASMLAPSNGLLCQTKRLSLINL